MAYMIRYTCREWQSQHRRPQQMTITDTSEEAARDYLRSILPGVIILASLPIMTDRIYI